MLDAASPVISWLPFLPNALPVGLLEWSGLIEWLFVVELVLLATAAIFWLISLSMRNSAPDDPICRFVSVFWKIMLRRQVGVAAAVNALTLEKSRQYEQYKSSGDVEAIKELLSNENAGQEFDDTDVQAIVAQARAERGPMGEIEAPPPASVTLAIIVVPFSPVDKLVGVRGDTVTIEVTAGPEEGSANKIVIDLIAALLDVRPYQLNLTKGHYRANKVIQIAGIDMATVKAKSAKWS